MGEYGTNMTKDLFTFKTNMSEKAKIKQLEGQDHLVFPVIAAKEVVMNELLYPENELKKNVVSWNGVPITVNHPTKNEQNVSINSPEMLEKFSVGKFFNVRYDNGVKGEMWFNISQAEGKGFDKVVSGLKDGVMMEVSTGVLAEQNEISGIFKNKEYSGIVKGIIPDHLALLPNDVGACSVDDGCGTHRTNRNVSTQSSEDKGDKQEGKNRMIKAFNFLKDSIFKTNEIGNRGIRDQIMDRLQDEFGIDSFVFVEDVFNDFFVYEKSHKLFKRSYTVDNDDIVSFGNETIEVFRRTEFIEKKELKTNKKESVMDNKKELVKKILVGESIPECEECSLLKLNEETLSKLAADNKPKDKDSDNTGILVNKDNPEIPVKTEIPVKEESVDDVLSNIKNPEVKEVIMNAISTERKRKDEMISAIIANSKLEKDELKTMSISILEKLFNSHSPSVYLGKNGFSDNGDSNLPPSAPPVLSNLKKGSE